MSFPGCISALFIIDLAVTGCLSDDHDFYYCPITNHRVPMHVLLLS